MPNDDKFDTCARCGHPMVYHKGESGCIVADRVAYPKESTRCSCRGPEHDLVNHPPHYTQHPSGIECIQVTEHMSFNVGNAVKYLWRADLKGGIEDLRKAAWYVNREIERCQRKHSSNA